MVGVDVRGGQNWTKVKAHGIKRANEYCASLGRKMVLTHTETSGARGWTPQGAEIQFECVSETDPDYQRVRMHKDPDAVIQVQGQ